MTQNENQFARRRRVGKLRSGRDTADACRAKAVENLAVAVTLHTSNHRTLLEHATPYLAPIMFGFSGGESLGTVARKRRYLIEARAHSPFLTHFDANTIKTSEQLVTMVKDRSPCSHAGPESDVLE